MLRQDESFLSEREQYWFSLSRVRWCGLRYGVRMNDQDVQQHILCVLRRDASRDILRVRGERDGKSSNSDDDDKRSNGANTSHVPSSCVRTTNSGNIPSTRENAKRTMRRSRTNRRLQVCKYIRAQ